MNSFPLFSRYYIFLILMSLAYSEYSVSVGIGTSKKELVSDGEKQEELSGELLLVVIDQPKAKVNKDNSEKAAEVAAKSAVGSVMCAVVGGIDEACILNPPVCCGDRFYDLCCCYFSPCCGTKATVLGMSPYFAMSAVYAGITGAVCVYACIKDARDYANSKAPAGGKEFVERVPVEKDSACHYVNSKASTWGKWVVGVLVGKDK